MNEGISSLGISLAPEDKFPSGIGYIALPSDIDRDTYILDCYQNFRVSLHTAHDGFMNRVMISEDDLNFIEFPSDYTQLGTAVMYITESISNQPYVVKRYHKTKKVGTGSENTFYINRVFNDALVEISGNPEKGQLNISVNNDTNSELNINVLNKNDDAEFNLNVRGAVNVNATDSVNVSANNQVYSVVFDPQSPDKKSEIIQVNNTVTVNATSTNIKGSALDISSDSQQTFETPNFKVTASDKVTFDTSTFSINEGKENLVLGQKFKSFATDLINEISQSTVATMLGTMPLINEEKIAAYNEKIDDFLSTIGYIDK